MTSIQSLLRGMSALSFAAGLFFSAQSAQAQLPAVNVKTPDGKTVSAAEIKNDGKPMIVSFWATWCKPCIQELNAVHENYPDWVKETGVKVVAVSIDDARSSGKVGPFVKSRRWEFETLVDENSDLKRAMNVTNVPHTFVLGPDGKIIYQSNSFMPGDEDKLYEKIKASVKK